VLPRWVLWKTVERNGKPTKVPFQVGGREAESDNPETWDTFEFALTCYEDGGYDGIGFMFGKEPGGFVGVDLDGCRDPESGTIADWAREIILKFNSYSEISPSQTGVKIFCHGKSPFDTGKNLKLLNFGSAGGKNAGIEIYDHCRYFAVTGIRIKTSPLCNERSNELAWLKDKFWPDASANGKAGGEFYGDDSVIERARKYLAKCPPAISGQNGSAAAFKVACLMVCGFGLSRETSLVLFREWNQTCQPPWSEREIEHKIDDAAKQGGPRNYLRNIVPSKWESVDVPAYKEPVGPTKGQPLVTSMVDATEKYIALIESGGGKTISLGIPQLDEALGGGVEIGEFVILAARPSHGKSMLAMQFLHYWSTIAMPTMFISEEMPAVTLGKRALQFISKHPQKTWRESPETVREELRAYAEYREKIVIIENCVSLDMAVQQIEDGIKEHGIKIAVVDYLQCLKAKGKDKTEQVSNSSQTLRNLAHTRKILIIILCHLNRQIEGRKTFTPVMADLKDSGQIEQDGDVILFLVWPWQVDNKRNPKEFNIFIAKNRNRGIQKHGITCELDAARQTISDPRPENYEDAFDDDRPMEEQSYVEF